MLEEAGFKPVEHYYSAVNDLTFIDAEPERLKQPRYVDLLRLTIRRPTKLNLLRAVAYPLVKLIPSLRMLLVIVSKKYAESSTKTIERWG
jgi:hypothetical protein